jgi:hypothetical protein
MICQRPSSSRDWEKLIIGQLAFCLVNFIAVSQGAPLAEETPITTGTPDCGRPLISIVLECVSANGAPL